MAETSSGSSFNYIYEALFVLLKSQRGLYEVVVNLRSLALAIIPKILLCQPID